MPSWDIHKIVCEELIGFYEQEIDKFIDYEFAHDASRYDIKQLNKVINIIYNKYGSNGLKQLIVHHYLDRLADILLSELIHYFEVYLIENRTIEESIHELISSIKTRLDLDPANILNLFIQSLDRLMSVTGILYSGKGKRQKRLSLEERLKKAYNDLFNYPNLKHLLTGYIRDVISRVKTNLEFILYVIIVIDEERVDNKILQSFIMKQLGIYKPWKYQSEKDFEEIVRDKIRHLAKFHGNITLYLENVFLSHRWRLKDENFRKVLIKRIKQLNKIFCSSTDLEVAEGILRHIIKLSKEINIDNIFKFSVLNSTMTDNNKNERRRDFRKILAKKILQLDELYNTANDFKSKAILLSQIIQLINEINPNLMGEEIEIKEWSHLPSSKKKLYDIAYDVIIPIVEGRGIYYKICGKEPIIWLDHIRAKILSYLAKEGLIS